MSIQVEQSRQANMAKIAKIIIVLAVVFFLVLPALLGSWYTVGQGERGVITRFGAVTGTAEPGLGFKVPYITGLMRISVQTQKLELDNEEAYSQDQQPAHMQISVNYSIVPGEVAEVFSQFGSADNLESRLIRPRVRQQVKNVFGHYTAATAISNRDKLNTEVRVAVQEAVKGPVEIEGVQIEDLKFSRPYEEAIEARMTAEVEVQKSTQRVANEKQLAQITVTQAQAQADSQLAVAKAEAEAIRIRGDAEAAAIKARGDALKDNPTLVTLTQAERWDGHLPTTMIPGAAVPMLNLGPQPSQ
jgi:regulator of protease activity HflC (stomatin/prohibitin superfamily)